MMYNILWIDDDFERLSHIKSEAKDYGLSLKGFKSLTSGFNELEKNYHQYDGVLLDAKFLESDDDESATADTDYVHRAKEKLWSLPKKFEIFVFTGQAEAFGSAEFKKAFPNVYIKGNDESVEKMFTDLKAAADRQQDTQLRHKFPEVFKILDEKCIGSKHSDTLLSVLKSLSDDSIAGVDEDFTSIRMVLETIFKRLSELEILPANFTDEKGWINGSSKFISNKHESYLHTDSDFFHPMVQETLFRIMNVVQDGSHNEGNLNYKCDDFCRTQKTGYLYKSTVYAFLDVLVYFRKLMDDNQNPEENRKRWAKKENLSSGITSTEKIEGFVSEIQPNGWGKFTSKDLKIKLGIPPTMVVANQLKQDDPVAITVKEENKGHINTIAKI